MTRPGPIRVWMGRLLAALGPFLGLVLVVCLFAWWAGDLERLLAAMRDGNLAQVLAGDPAVSREQRLTYLSPNNLRAVAVQTAIIGTCGIGMTLIIIGGGIDLSIGSIVALSSVVLALVFNGQFNVTIYETCLKSRTGVAVALVVGISIVLGLVFASLRNFKTSVGAVLILTATAALVFSQSGGWAALAAAIFFGVVAGLLNGLLVTASRVVPFIITLGTMEIFRGFTLLLARETKVNVADRAMLEAQFGWLDRLMAPDPEPAWLRVAPGVWLMVFAGILAMVLLHRTRLGRYIFAIGSNEEAARLSGVPVSSVKLWMYGLAGLMTGLAGVMQFSRLANGDPTVGGALELQVIAAVVIGGGSLRGGAGSIIGTFIGAFTMSFMRNGCDLAGIPNSLQRIIIGGIIILAVALDELRHGAGRRA